MSQASKVGQRCEFIFGSPRNACHLDFPEEVGAKSVSFRSRMCLALSWLKLHDPDCEHCAAQDCVGLTIGRRLRELNEHTQPRYQQDSDGEVTKSKDGAA